MVNFQVFSSLKTPSPKTFIQRETAEKLDSATLAYSIWQRAQHSNARMGNRHKGLKDNPFWLTDTRARQAPEMEKNLGKICCQIPFLTNCKSLFLIAWQKINGLLLTQGSQHTFALDRRRRLFSHKTCIQNLKTPNTTLCLLTGPVNQTSIVNPFRSTIAPNQRSCVDKWDHPHDDPRP